MGISIHVRQGFSLATAGAAVLALTLAGSGPAWADDSVDVSASDGVISLVNPAEGHTYQAVRVGEYQDATVDTDKISSVSVGTVSDIVPAAQRALKAVKGSDSPAEEAYTGNPLGEVASKWLGYGDTGDDTVSGSGLPKQAWGRDGKLRSFVTNLVRDTDFVNAMQASTISLVAGGADEAAFTGLPEGLYVIEDTTGSNTSGRSNSIPILVGTTLGPQKLGEFKSGTTVGSIRVKDDEPTISKEVIKKSDTGAAFSIGDYIHYRVRVRVPLTTGYDPNAYVYRVQDLPSTGLEFVDGDPQHPVSVSGRVGLEATAASPIKAERYTVLPGALENGARGVTFDLAHLVTDNEPATRLTWQDDIIIDYYMQINDSAKAGEVKNRASLTYSNKVTDQESTGSVSTDPDDPAAQAYFYNISLHKVARASGASLTGATFALSKDGGSNLYFIQDSSAAGRYKLSLKQSAPASGETQTRDLKVDDRGYLQVDGLGAGTYTVEETKAPQGFSDTFKPSFQIGISVKDSQGKVDASSPLITNGKDSWGLVAPSSSDQNLAQVVQAKGSTPWRQDSQEIAVNNINSISQLPLTGGAGVVAAALVVVLLVGLAGLLILVRRRRDSLRA